jgi:hypothetical protein
MVHVRVVHARTSRSTRVPCRLVILFWRSFGLKPSLHYSSTRVLEYHVSTSTISTTHIQYQVSAPACTSKCTSLYEPWARRTDARTDARIVVVGNVAISQYQMARKEIGKPVLERPRACASSTTAHVRPCALSSNPGWRRGGRNHGPPPAALAGGCALERARDVRGC